MTFLPFFVVLFAGVLFSELFRRLHLPWVVALIIGGMIIGQSGFGFLETNETITFFSQIGLIFLMFMAGLETNLSTFKEAKKKISFISFANSTIPFLTGILIALFFGFPLVTALLVGIIFMSSSIAVVIPALESTGLLDLKFGKMIVASTIVQDVLSLVFLSILIQNVNPITSIPLPVFYLLTALFIIVARLSFSRFERFFQYVEKEESNFFQQELRLVFTLLVGAVLVFELLGLHPIIAGFFAGLMLSNIIKSPAVKEKLRTVSYGIFIPIFFVVVGAETNIGEIINARETILITSVIIVGSIFAKFISGYLSGRALKYDETSSALIGASTIPQLSTTLAVAFTGVELGILDSTLATSLVLLSIVTTFASPILIRILSKKINPKTI